MIPKILNVVIIAYNEISSNHFNGPYNSIGKHKNGSAREEGPGFFLTF